MGKQWLRRELYLLYLRLFKLNSGMFKWLAPPRVNCNHPASGLMWQQFTSFSQTVQVVSKCTDCPPNYAKLQGRTDDVGQKSLGKREQKMYTCFSKSKMWFEQLSIPLPSQQWMEQDIPSTDRKPTYCSIIFHAANCRYILWSLILASWKGMPFFSQIAHIVQFIYDCDLNK